MSEEKQALEAATERLMVEIANFLLLNGVDHRDFARLSRRAYRQAGEKILRERGEFTSSKLIDFAGLTRKDIAPLNNGAKTHASRSEKTWTKAMSGLHKWHTRAHFVDESGSPRPLDLNDFKTIDELFHLDGETEVGALLAELQDAGCIEEVSAGRWKPVTRYYIPKNKVLKFHYFGRAVARFVATLNRNINNPTVDPWVERVVSSKVLKSSAKPLFARVGKQQALRFIEGLDDWTSSNETQSSIVGDTEQGCVGLGVYFFEED